MSQDPSVSRRQVEIKNELGLHLSPASKFVKLAGVYKSEIRVSHNGKAINGKSILDLTLLAAERGAWLDLEATGPDAAEAVSALARLVESEFRGPDDSQEKEKEKEKDKESAP